MWTWISRIALAALLVAAPRARAESLQTQTVAATPNTGHTTTLLARGEEAVELAAAQCTTVTVVSGDGCSDLARKCGIHGDDFMRYNPAPAFCATLQPGMRACCSAGDLPGTTRPVTGADGSCKNYTTVSGDSCWSIATANGLVVEDLERFNANLTWGWNNCSTLWVGVNMCLSAGAPPMPAPLPGAMCGPQVPGTQKPSNWSDLVKLNECPLSVCCDVHGRCGTTNEFCEIVGGAASATGPRTQGCISNCGTSIVKDTAAPRAFMKIGFFEADNFDTRSCLHMDIEQVDTIISPATGYTHVHFAFAELDPTTYSVDVVGSKKKSSSSSKQKQFRGFLALQGVQRIVSIGGWEFSTSPATYKIFREGVKPANRDVMARKIADFVLDNRLDGVEIDWEYPGAPDLPDIPAASPTEGLDYLAFLRLLKGMLPNRSVSIAAPPSFWYLRGFPIRQIASVVDYIVYMTYDLHGQWEYGKPLSADAGCPRGSCLRSHVNLTETVNALTLITKAGVPTSRIAVGISSYGRGFQLADRNCSECPTCSFTGPASGAVPGRCTAQAGVLADAEIKEILRAGEKRGVREWHDERSDSDVVVYDGDQWVAWMDAATKRGRIELYRSWRFAGVADWAVSLQDFRE